MATDVINWTQSNRKASLIERLLHFSQRQEKNRFAWVALAFFFQGCVMAPITIAAIYFNGNSMFLWMICIIAFVLVEITSLAATPMKVIIPVFFGSILLDIACIILSFTI